MENGKDSPQDTQDESPFSKEFQEAKTPLEQPLKIGIFQHSAYPAFVLILGWLIPGAGHWILGKALKGLIFFIILNLTYLIGIIISNLHCVSIEEHSYAFFTQILSGGFTIFTCLMNKAYIFQMPEDFGVETGVLFTSIAGLLNLLVICDATRISLKQKSVWT